MPTFPRSKVLQFYKENPNWHSKGVLGRQFLDFMKIEETPENKGFFDQLRTADSGVAGRLIIKHTDWNK